MESSHLVIFSTSGKFITKFNVLRCISLSETLFWTGARGRITITLMLYYIEFLRTKMTSGPQTMTENTRLTARNLYFSLIGLMSFLSWKTLFNRVQFCVLQVFIWMWMSGHNSMTLRTREIVLLSAPCIFTILYSYAIHSFFKVPNNCQECWIIYACSFNKVCNQPTSIYAGLASYQVISLRKWSKLTPNQI